MATRFRDRADAGRTLAGMLSGLVGRQDLLVLALPRGGVPVAFEIATALHAPLDLLLVRKLGVPGHEELAMGAIASGGTRVLNLDVIDQIGIGNDIIDRVAEREATELERRDRAYRGDRPALDARGRIVVLVDDGLATGSTMRAAIDALRQQGPARIIAAVPVGAPQVCREIGERADEIVCAMTPAQFYAVGLWYDDFSETSDDEVRDLLERASVVVAAGNPESETHHQGL